MGRNIKYQFHNAINQAFSEGGLDKHSIKKSAENKMGYVFSFKERANLTDTSAQLSSYIKANYPGIKLIADITPQIVQQFLNGKAGSCSRQTLEQYRSRLNKLDVLVSKIYRINVGWKGEIVSPCSMVSKEKIRDIAMDRGDFQRILDYAYQTKSKSQAVLAIELADRLMARVSETNKLQPRDVDYERAKVHIHESKGGRSRDITVTKEDLEYLKQITFGKADTERIVQIKEDSVNRFLQRIELKLGIRGKYASSKSGVHAIRKMKAQETFDQYRKSLNIRQALDRVSEDLGHGKNRDVVVRQYVLFVR